ncbi:aquaporin family protein [Heliobacterium undosum]|uniref:Aquaporin family protein n=1 Tax=Heliomicrobium undosum TaxID=121734 RepID=A0A845L5Z2_9FIRM|nr:MIP/aquaporin family protein [Heliomicrobium undosum]MZP30090.1 aquaporin family protein [Heliomicrobium undosum]
MNYLFGEFFGTVVLLIFGAGVVANVLLKGSKAEGSGWLVITAGWAFAVIMGIASSVATGGQGDLNPAVTLAKTLIGVYTFSEAVAIMGVQVAGAIVGSAVVWLAFLPHWELTEDKGAKLGIFCTAPAVRNTPANLLCEIIATIMLIVPVFALTSKAVAVPAGMVPYMVGILIWGIGLSLGGPTGYAINPARDLGPRIAHAILPIAGKGGSDWGYAWIPVVGPFIGGVCAYYIALAAGILK